MKNMYGDRKPAVHCTFPAEAFYHNNRGGCVLDVTQAPFFAKGDGVSDDTEALCAAMTFVREHREVVSRGEKTMCHPRGDRNWIIYLPDGIYSVRNTVSQNWPARAMNILDDWSHINYFQVQSADEEWELYRRSPQGKPCLHCTDELTAIDNNDGCFIRGQYGSGLVYDEINWNIRIFGESRENTVIRLQDNAEGFGPGAQRSVLSFFLLQRGSNINLGNFLENLTIDTGRNNPGAVALRWNSSNWGGIRNVRLCSGDGNGAVALMLDCNNATGYCRDLLLEGFETGIDLSAGRETMLVLEYATIRQMKKLGVHVGDARSGGGADCFNGRLLLVEETPCAMVVGQAGQGILLESSLEIQDKPWQIFGNGFLLWRSLEARGQRLADGCTAELQAAANLSWQSLEIREQPLFPSCVPAERIIVEDFGAIGDGHTDDTAAVQRAMDSGAPVICFSRSNYVINGTVRIPATVREITGLFAGIQRSVRSDHLNDSHAIFTVAETAESPLLIHQIATGGGIFLDHEAERVTVLEDIMVLFNHCRVDAAEDNMLFPSAVPQDAPLWRLYRNSHPEGPRKKLFVTDCLGFAADDGMHDCSIENVAVWGRFLDTEHVETLYSFRNCQAWVFGFKSENTSTLIRACSNSHVEFLGGTLLEFSRHEEPVLESHDSSLSACFCFWHWQLAPEVFRFDRMKENIQKTASEKLPHLPENDIGFVYSC